MDDKPYTVTTTIDHLEKWRAIAASRLELLRRIAGVLPWCPYCEMLVDGNILRHTINCELAEALGDGAERKTGYGANDWS